MCANWRKAAAPEQRGPKEGCGGAFWVPRSARILEGARVERTGLSEDAAFVTARGVNEELANSTKKGLRSGGTEALGIGYARSSFEGKYRAFMVRTLRLCGSKRS